MLLAKKRNLNSNENFPPVGYVTDIFQPHVIMR